MTILDWRKHATGRPQPCIHCHRDAICRDQAGRPCHKVCAETATVTSAGRTTPTVTISGVAA